MRILQPKEGQTYLYFYKDSDLNPSQNISLAKKLLKEVGCKVGPAWKREQPEYYICKCDIGEFRLVNDVPANYIESENYDVIKYLADRLIVVCHKYKKNSVVRLVDGKSATVKDYINEDYIIDDGIIEKQLVEEEIVCLRRIPDDVLNKKVCVHIIDPDFGEYETYEGIVIKAEMSQGMMCITLDISEDELLGDEAYNYEHTIFENEIKSIRILE